MIHKLYNDEVEVNFMEKAHRYKVDGSFKPGVSTVLNILHKDLMKWAVWMAVGKFKEDIETYATTTQKMTKIAFKEVCEQATKAHENKSQKGKDVGSIVHAWVYEECTRHTEIDYPQYAMDMIAEDDSDIKLINTNVDLARHCVQQWRKWVKDYDVEFIELERVVYSKKLGYCGTFDLLFRSKRDGKLYIGDYKTSEPQKLRNSKYQITGYKAYPEHYAQCTAYDYAYNEEMGVEPDGYAVIYLPKEGEYQMFTREAVKEDREGWENLFKTYQWMSGIKKQK